jgi:hypothetical protein
MATNGSEQPLDWKTLYQLALLELEPIKLPARISEARRAIIERLETKPYIDQLELNDALSGLHVVLPRVRGEVTTILGKLRSLTTNLT